MMPVVNLHALALDSILWIACVALPVNLTAHWLRQPLNAFVAGAVSVTLIAGLALLTRYRPELKLPIVHRLTLTVVGVVMGVYG